MLKIGNSYFPSFFLKIQIFSDFSRTSNFSKSKLEKKDNFHQKCTAFDMENASKMVKNCLFSSKMKKTYDSMRAFRCSVFRSRTFLRSAFMLAFQSLFSFSNCYRSFPGLALPVFSTGYFSGSVIFLAQKRLFSPKT